MGADDAEEYRAMFEGVELGTEATRTGIIDNARNSGYIQLKKDVYTILPDGIYLIEALERMNISMDKFKTSEMGRALKKVYRGEIGIGDSVGYAVDEIKQYFYSKDTELGLDSDIGFFGDIVGKCPLCGKNVFRGKYNYGCSGYKEGCKFRIYMSMCNRTISIKYARQLLEEGRTEKITGFKSKAGKSFDAVLKLDGDKCVFDFGS